MSLLTPLSFPRGPRAKNPIAVAPLTNQQSHPDGHLSDEERRWLVRRAQGGFGLVWTCAAHVSKDGQGFPGQLGFFSDELLPGLTRFATELRAPGALAIAQLHHAGIRAPASLVGTPVGPSSVQEDESKPVTPAPREATPEDIARISEDFLQAALRARRAGFDGVELHGAHGYWLGQLLSTYTNRRQDEYGGSLENRARVLLELVRRIRAQAPELLLGVRLSPENFGNIRGLDLDESLQVARWLADAGVDFVHLSLWRVDNPTSKRPSEHPIPLFRQAIGPKVRLVCAGAIWSKEDAERTLERGADIVALGRAAIVNPDWPEEVAAKGREPLRLPVSKEHLLSTDVSPTFLGYLQRFQGFVAP